jgi:hypothetical protein
MAGGMQPQGRPSKVSRGRSTSRMPRRDSPSHPQRRQSERQESRATEFDRGDNGLTAPLRSAGSGSVRRASRAECQLAFRAIGERLQLTAALETKVDTDSWSDEPRTETQIPASTVVNQRLGSVN